MTKRIMPWTIPVTSVFISFFVSIPVVHAGELSQKLESQHDKINNVIDTHQSNIKQHVNDVENKIEVAKEAVDLNDQQIEQHVNTLKHDVTNVHNKLKEQHDTVKKDVNDVHNTLKEHHNHVHQTAETIKKDIEEYKSAKSTVKHELDGKLKEKQQHLNDIINQKDRVSIHTEHLPNIDINKRWFNEKYKHAADVLFQQFEEKVIDHLQFEQKLIQLVTAQLEDYIKVHENRFKLLDLIDSGFNLSTLSDKNKSLIEHLQHLHEINQISDNTLNTRALEIIKHDLKEKGDLLERIKNEIANHNDTSDLDLSSGFADTFTDRFNDVPVTKPTTVNNNSSNKTNHSPALPDSGEKQNKPLIIAGGIILLLGLLMVIRSKKNRK
ncbi:LPXTG cell wall anchor domain-containing protein [Macrococcus capreoli]|uniref:LPXTG cell wall anchor domain-containing protein n=1 Tax=Macrococcus capreoli TaxID=2982690 RepID=UPI003F4362FC